MAFSYARTTSTVMGNKRVHFGTFAQVGGDTGGAITTGLRSVDNFQMNAEIENVSTSGGVVTVTTEDPGGAQAGYWMAIGV